MLSIAWQQTRKHPNNLSKSKSAFGFTRDSRFKYSKTSLCDSFYDIPSTLGKAPASGIGKGHKTPIINPSVFTPSPQSYKPQARLTLSRRGGKFSSSRDKVQCQGMFDKSATPEPGHYQSKSQFKTKKGFTIYSKLALPTFTNAKNPGPSHYKSTDNLSQSGRYILSQLSNCPGYKIKPGKKLQLVNCNPGPGQYGNENLNCAGKYWNSKHENSRCRTFSKSSKDVSRVEKIPGPGTYNYVSEFGRK